MPSVQLSIVAEALLRLIAAAPTPPTHGELCALLRAQGHDVGRFETRSSLRLLQSHLLVDYHDLTVERAERSLQNMAHMLDHLDDDDYVPDDSAAARFVVLRAGWLLLSRKSP